MKCPNKPIGRTQSVLYEGNVQSFPKNNKVYVIHLSSKCQMKKKCVLARTISKLAQFTPLSSTNILTQSKSMTRVFFLALISSSILGNILWFCCEEVNKDTDLRPKQRM